MRFLLSPREVGLRSSMEIKSASCPHQGLKAAHFLFASSRDRSPIQNSSQQVM